MDSSRSAVRGTPSPTLARIWRREPSALAAKATESPSTRMASVGLWKPRVFQVCLLFRVKALTLLEKHFVPGHGFETPESIDGFGEYRQVST